MIRIVLHLENKREIDITSTVVDIELSKSAYRDLAPVVMSRLAQLIASNRAMFKSGFVPREQDSNELHQACEIIRALLGAPPPRIWKKWPNIKKHASEFLRKNGDNTSCQIQ